MNDILIKLKMDYVLLSTYVVTMLLASGNLLPFHSNDELLITLFFFAVCGYKILKTKDVEKLKLYIFTNIIVIIIIGYLI